MNKLGTIDLPEQAQWVDRFSVSNIASSNRLTIGGKVLIEESQSSDGREITIVFEDGVSWLSTSEVLEIKKSEAVVGGNALLEWEGELIQVVFNRSKPCNFKPIQPLSNYYVGQINLLRI